MVARTSASEYRGTGRRKTAVARVRIMPGEGKRQVNGLPMAEYFKLPALIHFVEQPLLATELETQYDVIARISGGGKVGQAGALRHGIARALVQADDTLKGVLKDGGYLTRDPRMKERKKVGQPGARKRFQFSKR